MNKLFGFNFNNQISSQFNNQNLILWLIICINFTFLIFAISSLSISYKEAYLFYNDTSFFIQISKISTLIFGQNDYSLRLPFVFFHILNILLLFKVSKIYLKKENDSLWVILIYSLMPGVNSAAILLNSSSISIFITLLFIYLYENKKYNSSFAILIISIFLDNSFAVLFFSLIFFSIFKKDNHLLVLSLILFGISMNFYELKGLHGKPKGYFQDVIGIYAAIFSPFLFLFFFYSIYRILVKDEKNLLWFIVFASFCFSLVLSFRQKISIDDFAPFVVIGVVLVVKVFFASYRIRLPMFRKNYNLGAIFVLTSLILLFLIINFNKSIYFFIKDPTLHPAYKHYIAKELAKELKTLNIKTIFTDDKQMSLRLKFYGIGKSQRDSIEYFLSSQKKSDKDIKVSISYINRVVATYYVSKVNI